MPMPMSCAEPLRVSVPADTQRGIYVFLFELGVSWVYVGIDIQEGIIKYLIDGCSVARVFLDNRDNRDNRDERRQDTGSVDIRNFVYALLSNGSDTSIAQILLRKKDNTNTDNITRNKDYGLKVVQINWLGATDNVYYENTAHNAMASCIAAAIENGAFTGTGGDGVGDINAL